MSIDDVVRVYATELQRIYDERTAGDNTFTGVLAEFMREVKPLLEGTDMSYTTNPTHLRVYWEETGDDFGWHVDGADHDGNYTDDVRRFLTLADALAAAEMFVADNGFTLTPQPTL